MLFTSFEFLIFLPIVFIFYWFVCGKNLKVQNFLVVLASYVFYGWWNWKILVLVAITSFLCWGCGLGIAKYKETNPSRAKAFNITNIVINLGILCVFKYYDFFAQSFADAFLGGKSDGLLLNLILPIGISFYTFKALSYSIDVLRGTIKAEKDSLPILAYIGFFPQLLAGPIERPGNLIPQFKKLRTFTYEQGADGCRQFLWGSFKKIVVADNCAAYVNEVWGNLANESGSTLMLAAILYCFQIYGDFSGYSDMSIGIGKLLGIESKKNFDVPYFSRSIVEFWRRWHISLTSWFRDYIYIPMGGSRCCKARVIFNTMVVFLVSGLWHGANWTFITWGAYNGLLFVPRLLMGKKNVKERAVVAEDKFLPSLKECGHMLLTFMFVLLGWILFRAESIQQAGEYMNHILSTSIFSIPHLKQRTFYIPTSIALLILIIYEYYGQYKQFKVNVPSSIRCVVYIFIILFIIFYGSPATSYIYFQF